jgi:hypothetical protein
MRTTHAHTHTRTQPGKKMERSTLLNHTQWLATTFYHDQRMCFYESCSLDTLKNAFDKVCMCVDAVACA